MTKLHGLQPRSAIVAGLRDRRGAVALIFGLSLIPVALMVGLSLDYARALQSRERLAQAIDAAALAAASWNDLTEAQAKQKVQDYFNANYPTKEVGLAAPLSITVNQTTITVQATAQVPTTFLKLGGFQKIDVGAQTEVTKKLRKIELVMALDNTGSMDANGKITALKNASKQLVEILFQGKTSFPNGEVKIGLVPFAGGVNIGADKLNSGWIDTLAQSAIAYEDFQSGVNVLTLYDKIKNRDWNGCVRARKVPYDTDDTAPGGGVDTLFAPYFAPDEPDFSQYGNSYASDNGYSGGNTNYDARQRYTGKYNNLTISSSSKGPEFNCTVKPVTPLNSTKSILIDALSAMAAGGSTVIPEGLAWAWRLISPTAPFAEGVAYDDDKTIKAIILLTDGANDVGGGLGNHNRSFYSAFGFAQSGHLGSTSGSQAEAVLNAKTATVCNNIKAKNIRLYTITFQLGNGPIKDLMRNCASDPKMYYDSPSNSQLSAIFTEIANGLSDLRISK